MTSREIRQSFLDFFRNKAHKIVPSAPIVVKDDPTLMFTNAGMNQFKDFFLGNRTPAIRRVADTQKCLRVSGKHNDLEEVGRDGYHHTMFEMLGNWSFGDYFKNEAIEWAWELLTEVYKLPKDRLYVSVFEGDASEGLERDEEAATIWRKFVEEDHILYFNKKDNFWEMGETGPSGPCSEIHIDLRPEAERKRISGKKLVNADSPLVIEIWNLVFIQFNRKADGSLEPLRERHVDTGMGFERLCMALQNKTSNYDTDIFRPFIEYIEKAAGKKYTGSYSSAAKTDIAMRVIADHIRAVGFAIADGALPANTGAGYVIRRILRRAVRYYYSFLDLKEPFLHSLVPLLADSFSQVFPELKKQQDFIAKVILEEERAFLRTLEGGIKRLESLEVDHGVIDGKSAFELYDTFGFPIDLTRLMAEEKGWRVDEVGFENALKAQKERSRKAAEKETGDWISLSGLKEVVFFGYDQTKVENARVIKYRTVKVKKGNQYQIVLDKTPFYAESGGQVGDTGILDFGGQQIKVLDTQKENELIIHRVEKLPDDLNLPVTAQVDLEKRRAIAANHSATHLMHEALHQVLGNHALQRGQDVDHQRLRFDFSHFQKVTEEELRAVEAIVNDKIRENIPLEEARNIPLEDAKNLGATMLFGEKYGDRVRIVTFDEKFSRELCGGTHVVATGAIGFFKITTETSVAAGIRRIEAVTAKAAEIYVNEELKELNNVRGVLNHPKNVTGQILDLQEQTKVLKKQVDKLLSTQAADLKDRLKSQAEQRDGYQLIIAHIPIQDAAAVKTLAYNLEKELDKAVIVFTVAINGKPRIMVAVSKSLTEEKNLHAGQLVKTLAHEIKGGGGGQPFYAEAGGSDISGLEHVLSKAREILPQ